jgi:hypothetical protein
LTELLMAGFGEDDGMRNAAEQQGAATLDSLRTLRRMPLTLQGAPVR